MQSTVRATYAWTALLREGPEEARRDLLRLHRPEGVQPGGVWLIGVVVRKASTGGWHAQAIDEVYPATRFQKLLPLRCKDFLDPAAPKPEADNPAERARKALE